MGSCGQGDQRTVDLYSNEQPSDEQARDASDGIVNSDQKETTLPKKDEVMTDRQNQGNDVTSVGKGKRESDAPTSDHTGSTRRFALGWTIT